MSSTFDQILDNVDSNQLNDQIAQKSTLVSDQRFKLQQEIDQKISTIILVKKRKLDYSAYTEAASRLKMFLTSAKHLIDVYFNLLDDQEKLILYNLTDIKDLISKMRFCLFRSVHNMNRMLIKENEQSQTQVKNLIVQVPEQNKKGGNSGLKKKKRKKGKNSKMSIDQTGCMYKWILQNFENPYPSQQQKEKLSADSKISISKVNYWFINMRERTLKKLMSGENSGYGKKKRAEKCASEKEEFNSEEGNSQLMMDESVEDDESSS